MLSPSTHPSSETNLLSPRTSWVTKVICLRPRARLYPLSGQMLWHKGGPDAPLSSWWPLSLFQSLRKGPKVEKVLGTGHIAALITHSVTIEPNVWSPPPLGLTPSWRAGKVMGPLWLVHQQSAKTAPLCPLPQLCSRWLTAAKCCSTVTQCTGITSREEQAQIIGGVRRWVTGGTSSHQRLFAGCLVQTKKAFLERYLPEASPADILTVPVTVIGWGGRERERGYRKMKESVHRQDIPCG